jgi:hypothetical protein
MCEIHFHRKGNNGQFHVKLVDDAPTYLCGNKGLKGKGTEIDIKRMVISGQANAEGVCMTGVVCEVCTTILREYFRACAIPDEEKEIIYDYLLEQAVSLAAVDQKNLRSILWNINDAVDSDKEE